MVPSLNAGIGYFIQTQTVAVTGTANETTLASFKVGGRRIGQTGLIIMDTLLDWTASANNKTIKIKLNSGFIENNVITSGTQTSQRRKSLVFNQNNFAAQVEMPVVTGGGNGGALGNGNNLDFLTEDMNNEAVISITGQLANGANTLNLRGVLAELFYYHSEKNVFMFSPYKAIYKSNSTAVSVTGTTNPTDLISITIPAGTVGINDVIRITPMFSLTNSGNGKTLVVEAGGQTIGSFTGGSVTNSSCLRRELALFMKGSLNSQEMFNINSNAGVGNSNPGIVATTIDFSGNVTVKMVGTLANAGETITAEYMIVEIFKNVGQP